MAVSRVKVERMDSSYGSARLKARYQAHRANQPFQSEVSSILIVCISLASHAACGRAPELFFFSSRRRHTRCGRDWSSDVRSSDLPEDLGVLLVILGIERLHGLQP